MIVPLWLAFFFFWLFVLGCAVGSFLNVVIYRLPRHKNLGWPSSRCGSCLTPIPLKDNIPLLSYWQLRGRCRACGASFSMRYFWVEFLTGLLFVALYLYEIGFNAHHYLFWRDGGLAYLEWGGFAPESWPFFAGHAVLACLLWCAAIYLYDGEPIPRSLVLVGMTVGLGWSMTYPWPSPDRVENALSSSQRTAITYRVDETWPGGPRRGPMPEDRVWSNVEVSPRPGFVPWPVWGPLPEALPPGSLLLGLITGLAGVLVGRFVVGAVSLLHQRVFGSDLFGEQGLGLLLMSGGFLGWQPVFVALFLSVILLRILRRPEDTPDRTFARSILVAVCVVWLGWAWIGPMVHRVLFDPKSVVMLFLALIIGLFGFGAGKSSHYVVDESDS